MVHLLKTQYLKKTNVYAGLLDPLCLIVDLAYRCFNFWSSVYPYLFWGNLKSKAAALLK